VVLDQVEILFINIDMYIDRLFIFQIQEIIFLRYLDAEVRIDITIDSDMEPAPVPVELIDFRPGEFDMAIFINDQHFIPKFYSHSIFIFYIYRHSANFHFCDFIPVIRTNDDHSLGGGFFDVSFLRIGDQGFRFFAVLNFRCSAGAHKGYAGGRERDELRGYLGALCVQPIKGVR